MLAEGVLATVAGVALAVVLIVVGLVVVTVVLAFRLGRRVWRRRAPQARRLAEDAALRVRARGRPGANGEAARLRLEMRGSLANSRAVLSAAREHDSQLGEALALLGRLQELASGVETELALLEREPDPMRVQAALPAARGRAERIRHASDSLRWAAQERAGVFHDHELSQVCGEAAMEAGALRGGAQASYEVR